jgi:hypothetical protein
MDRILMGTMGPTQLPVKWVLGRGVDHPPTSIAEVKEGVELYLYSPSGPSLPVLRRTLRYVYMHLRSLVIRR